MYTCIHLHHNSCKLTLEIMSGKKNSCKLINANSCKLTSILNEYIITTYYPHKNVYDYPFQLTSWKKIVFM